MHRLVGAEQRARRRRAEYHNRARLNRGDLAREKRRAGFHLVALGRAILWWPAFYYVADINIRPAKRDAHAFGTLVDHLGEELSRASHKRQPLRIFISARPFTDKNHFRLRIPTTKDDRMPPLMQLAAGAIAKVRANIFHGFSIAGLQDC